MQVKHDNALLSASLQGKYRRRCAAAASVLWLPFRAYPFLVRLGGSLSDSTSPLADSSLLLLLVLINHSPQPLSAQYSSAQHPSAQYSPAQPQFHAVPDNPYLTALQALQDVADVGTDAESGLGQAQVGVAAVPFPGLYSALVANQHQEEAVLLLYALIHKCNRFQQYVLVRSDADVLLLPVLQR